MKNNFSWEMSFTFFAILMVLCAINLRALNIEKLEQQIEELETHNKPEPIHQEVQVVE